VFLILLVDVIGFLLGNLSPASWTLFMLTNFENHIAAILIFLNFANHEPVSVKTDHMETVKAIIDPYEIKARGEACVGIPSFIEIFKADGTSPSDSVVVLS
jgi:hypothetical protein